MVSERDREKWQTWHLYWILKSRFWNIVGRVLLCSRNWLISVWKTTDKTGAHTPLQTYRRAPMRHTQSNRFGCLARWCGESSAGFIHVIACAYMFPLEFASTSSANVIATCVRHEFPEFVSRRLARCTSGFFGLLRCASQRRWIGLIRINFHRNWFECLCDSATKVQRK